MSPNGLTSGKMSYAFSAGTVWSPTKTDVAVAYVIGVRVTPSAIVRIRSADRVTSTGPSNDIEFTRRSPWIRCPHLSIPIISNVTSVAVYGTEIHTLDALQEVPTGTPALGLAVATRIQAASRFGAEIRAKIPIGTNAVVVGTAPVQGSASRWTFCALDASSNTLGSSQPRARKRSLSALGAHMGGLESVAASLRARS